ncbi:DNA repair exonuclease [Limnohabitans sp. TS-CS-82]|uniref:metallophosphoesterase family protein n=1 Tax=Limnohabitans sp. TS-CS-82 TaxID=2094193 RepID=UPI000CF1CAEF|nr:DNA repair exonuclease [Limnohabitans sp. TS-CS-82]PQA81923.1 DNA repair exonuclease [Limnohabitans sp. TS-CS-82]
MKFIHAADLHLDSPLRGLSSYPDAPAERLRTATRDAFSNLVSHALDEQVDFMVIAGDVYDGDWKDYNTGLFFVRQMGRLRQAGIPVYLLYGNHDAESEMTRGLELPDNVHIFSSRKAESFRIDEMKVALHGRSFKVAATTENLLPSYPAPVAGWLNIGVLHTALEGNAQHARYAPCSIAELQTKGYQYWALGHVHEHWIHRGEVTIAYPGNLQGRHIRELGARGALMVTAEDSEITEVDRIEVDVLRWHALSVDIGAMVDRREAIRAVGLELEHVLDATPSHLPLAVRVLFKGQSAVHAALVADEGQLRQEILAQAVALNADRIWIEKISVLSEALDSESLSSEDDTQDALVELAGLALTAKDDPDFVQSLQADWMALLEKLPYEVLQASHELHALRQDPQAQIPDRLRQTTPMLMGRVTKSAGSST